MRHSELPVLAQIAKEAGDAIKAMQADIVKNKDWEVKEDNSPVTPADKKAHEIVTLRLRQHFPGSATRCRYGVVSEEASAEENAEGLKQSERFETDPLDNTTGYIKGLDGYSVNIGRIKNGVPVAGAVYFPKKDELYYTGDNGKAYFQKGNGQAKEIHVKELPLRAPVQVAAGFHEKHLEFLGERAYEAKPYPAQYRTCKVADGTCDVTGISKGAGGGYNSWDIAGPHAVLRAAGGEFINAHDGDPIRYGNEIKIPDHIAGSKNALIALGLTSSRQMQADRQKA